MVSAIYNRIDNKLNSAVNCNGQTGQKPTF